jgi:phosphate transport system permease protein
VSTALQARPDTATPFAAPARGRILRNRVAAVLMHLAFLVALLPLIWVLWTVVSRGLPTILEPTWWTNSQKGIATRDEGGGAYHAIIGSVIQVGIASIFSVPLGVMVAVYLVEYGTGRFARVVSFTVDILTGIPSIVAALFVYAAWITTFGQRRQGFAVSLALVLLMVPVIIRTTEEMLRLVPTELREAAYALGVPKWKTITKVVIPTAFAGIVTGVMLGIARIMGETAPLLILVGYTNAINMNPFKSEQAALPLMINTERQNVLETGQGRAWGAALTLILIVMALNLAARAIARYGSIDRKK